MHSIPLALGRYLGSQVVYLRYISAHVGTYISGFLCSSRAGSTVLRFQGYMPRPGKVYDGLDGKCIHTGVKCAANLVKGRKVTQPIGFSYM